MNSDWEELPLAEVSNNFDKDRIPVKALDRRKGPYPYYGASGIVDWVDDFIFDGEYLLVAEDGENLRSRKTPIAFIAKGKFWVNNHAHILQGNKKSNTKFLSYVLESKNISGYITGSTIPKLSRGNLDKILVSVPTLKEQREIVEIIDTLDKKIELNKKTNETLEDIAKTLFKSWFIDFAPVRAKAEGRSTGLPEEISDLFPNSFEDSELGEIPREWSICTIGDLLDLEKNSINPMESPDEIFDHYSIPAFDNGLTPSKDIGFSIKSNKFLIPTNTFLVCKLNPRFPRVWLPFRSSTRRNISSTEFLVCKYKEYVGLPFAYYLSKSKRVAQQMLNMATGTSSSHQRVRPKDFTSISAVRPNSKIIDCFNNAISPILEKFGRIQY